MQEDEKTIFYRYVCSKEWSNEPKRWDTRLSPFSIKFEVMLSIAHAIDRLILTCGISTFPYQRALAQLDKHKASL